MKNAGISKGLLFHYFKNKKQLYQFLFDYSVEITMKDFYEKINLDERDFFIKLHEIMQIKLELLNRYPAIFKFFEVAYLDTSSEAAEIFEGKSKEISESSIARVFNNIDITKFKENLELDKVINTVMWSLEEYGNTEIRKAKLTSSPIDYEKMYEAVDNYIEFFKKCFYK